MLQQKFWFCLSSGSTIKLHGCGRANSLFYQLAVRMWFREGEGDIYRSFKQPNTTFQGVKGNERARVFSGPFWHNLL